jgi:mRNA-degrading endonuclease toxin of MazEF toxin-antitoxin module
VRSGDILLVDFGNPVGSTPALIRPAIVITADQTLAIYATTLHVVPVTSNLERSWSTDVLVDGPEFAVDSVAQCHLCGVIDQLQIVTETGQNIGAVHLAQIRSVMADLLDLP